MSQMPAEFIVEPSLMRCFTFDIRPPSWRDKDAGQGLVPDAALGDAAWEAENERLSEIYGDWEYTMQRVLCQVPALLAIAREAALNDGPEGAAARAVLAAIGDLDLDDLKTE